MVKNQGLPQARLPPKVVVHLLPLVGLLVASLQVMDIHLGDLHIVVCHLRNQDIPMDQVDHLQDPPGLVDHLEDHHTVVDQVDLLHTEDQMVQVLTGLLQIELWVDTPAQEDPLCQEVQEVLLLALLVGHQQQDPQVLPQDQGQVPMVDALPQKFKSYRTQLIRWRRGA